MVKNQYKREMSTEKAINAYNKGIEKDNELMYTIMNEFEYSPVTLEMVLEKYSDYETEIIPIKEVICTAFLMFKTEVDFDAYLIDNCYY